MELSIVAEAIEAFFSFVLAFTGAANLFFRFEAFGKFRCFQKMK
ncbi:hypothetical protein [Phocaeicola abscessus]|nr:hypothetical protein [Phocaeicola abscessus]